MKHFKTLLHLNFKGNKQKQPQDFKFIGVEMDEKYIASTPKNEYKIKIKKLVEKAAFEYMIKVKN